MNSANSYGAPSAKIPKWLIAAFLAVSFFGFCDAAYLTAKHYLGTPVTCTILGDCETVLTSPYATVFGIPVALLGALYYLSIFLLAVLYFDTKKEHLLRFFLPLAAMGFLATLYFVSLQLFVIRAICEYCMLSALSSTILFSLGIYLYLARKRQ